MIAASKIRVNLTNSEAKVWDNVKKIKSMLDYICQIFSNLVDFVDDLQQNPTPPYIFQHELIFNHAKFLIKTFN